MSEFNRIDFIVLGGNLPVEVQSTPAGSSISEEWIQHSSLEKLIEKQIRENIDKYGKCWFFFDSEYFRYLQNDTVRGMKINLD